MSLFNRILALSLALFFFQPCPAQAQLGDFLDKLKDTVKKEVEEVTESITKGVEKTEDEIVEEVEDAIDVSPDNGESSDPVYAGNEQSDTSSSTVSTLIPASRLAGSSTLSVVRRGDTSTP